MPNWCNNTLRFESGKPIREFLQPYLAEIREGDLEFLFDKIIPIPEELNITASPATNDKELQEKYKSNKEKYGYENWWEFCVSKWGTKWTGGDGGFGHNDIGFGFTTAWSPPIGVIEELAKKLPDDEYLILEYMEEGDDYCGRYIAGNEGGVDETYSPISDAPDDLKQAFGWEPWEDDEE